MSSVVPVQSKLKVQLPQYETVHFYDAVLINITDSHYTQLMISSEIKSMTRETAPI